MHIRRLGKHSAGIVFAMLLALTGWCAAYAAIPTSNNYQLSESQFNAGQLNSCSDQYCAKASIGEAGSGESKSIVSTANFGSVTPNEPMLEVIVDPGVSNLGVLDADHTATKTMVVRIRNYVSNGYVLQITGTPPKYGNHYLATPSTPTASAAGTEQFAINAAANTSPSVGAVPEQVPSSQFSFGSVAADYQTPNLFKYQSEDVVARSTTQSGQTNYTISMIVNVSNKTPAGHYSGDFSAVVIPVY